MGLIPRETQNNINTALKILYSIDKSLGRIAEALEKYNEQTLLPEAKTADDIWFGDHGEVKQSKTAEWYDDHNE